MKALELAAAFVEARGAVPAEDVAAIGHALEVALATARAAWPGVEVDPARWAGALASRAPETVIASRPFADLEIADLYLAIAAAAGDPNALAACDALLVREATHAAAAARLHASLRDEAIQNVRTITFAPRAEAPPAIHDYAGHGRIGAWLRVMVAREMVRLAKAQRRSVELEDHMLDGGAFVDPALEALKTRYRAELAEAFRIALKELSARDRTLLRYQVVDGLTIDDIGTIYRVHRATAARWIAVIRDGIVERTRTLVAAALGVDTAEAASIVRLVQSRLDVSVIRHLDKRKR